MSAVIEKLKIIQNMATEVSVKQVCDVLIDYVKENEKQSKSMGFTSAAPKK